MSNQKFSKYLLNFTKNINDNKNLTHLEFRKGKYNVPNEKYDEFYKKYYECLVNNNESLYLIEKINENSRFAFFLDIEVPKNKSLGELKSDDVKKIIETTNKCIEKMFTKNELTKDKLIKDKLTDDKLTDYKLIKDKLTDYIVTKRNDKYHVNYYNLIVNSMNSIILVKDIINELNNEENGDIKNFIDISVYRTGLRMFGSKKSDSDIKKEKETINNVNYSEIYKIYDINSDRLYKIKDTSYEDFMKLVIKRPNDIKLSEINNEHEHEHAECNKKKINGKMNGNINEKMKQEIIKLLRSMKVMEKNSEYLEKYSMNSADKIKQCQNKNGMNCFYIGLENSDNYCPFVGRTHNRNTNPIYIEMIDNKMYIKCYDEDCLRKRYPDEGLIMPDDMSNMFPELYLSLRTKYWKSEIKITDEIKKLLEDSLSGSHYKIAKVIFTIFKNKFRIDDIKNPDWYEFDETRWSKTHIMNILISEELKKYYNGIKISDTNSLRNAELTEYVENKDKLEANMRNSCIDSIINKLENVTFKKNVMTEMYYLFKSLEPNFISKLDSNPNLIGFKNGVYDLENNMFRNGNSKDYLTLSTGYEFIEYDPNDSNVKEIYEFLSQIIPNKKVREYLLKILGRSLLGICDEKFYILSGLSGANGKSTLINLLEYTLGDYCTGCDISLLTNPRAISSSASPDVIRLKGKRLVSFAEPEYRDTLKTGLIKVFSGGDTVIARELYKAPISFKLQASMFMCCNDLPAINSVDGGTMRRLRVINFTSRFCDNPIKTNEFKIDPSIKTKIRNWRPYFMSILIHYYGIYQEEIKNGSINEPDEVKIATNKYKAENDKFDEYINESIKEDSNSFESIRNINNHFTKWYSINYSSSKIPDSKELKKSLKLRFGEEKVNGLKQTGFNVILNEQNSYDTTDVTEDDDL